MIQTLRSSGLLVAVLLLIHADFALAFDGVTLTGDFIGDSNDRTFLDKSIRIDYRQLHATGYLGNWQKGGEIGGYLLDQRRSAYDLLVRLRENDGTVSIGTDQVLTRGFVGKLQLRYIRIDEAEKPADRTNLWVYGAGFDKYYGDYHYFTAVYYNDPRESGRFSVVVSNTFATPNASLRLGVIPRSDGTRGYFATIKYHWLFFSYAYTREFDFATFDRRVLSLGVQIPFDLVWDRAP